MRRIADADWLTLFTATLGVYYILHGVSGWIWGRDTKAFPVTFDATPVHILGTIVSEGHLVNLAWAAGIGLVLYLFFKYTKEGDRHACSHRRSRKAARAHGDSGALHRHADLGNGRISRGLRQASWLRQSSTSRRK